MALRMSLWLELGKGDLFWLLLAMYTKDVIQVMKNRSPVEDELVEGPNVKTDRETMIDMNHPRFRQELSAVKQGTSVFVTSNAKS